MDRTFWHQLIRGVLVTVTAALIIAAIILLVPVVYPFLIGWFIAYMLNPAIRFLHEKGHFPRWLAVLFTLLVFLGIVGTILYFAINRLLIELNVMAVMINSRLQDLFNHGVQFINSDLFQNLFNQIDNFLKQNSSYQGTFSSSINSISTQISDTVKNIIQITTNLILSFASALPSIAIVTFVIILGAFLIGKDWNRLNEKLVNLIPERIKIPARGIWRDLEKALFGYIRAQLILISVTTLIVITGLLIMKVQYALSIGLLIGLFDLLPYLGTGFALIPWGLYCLSVGELRLGAGLLIVYGVIVVARQSAEPKILGSSIGLNPLATLFSMYVGLKLFGALGLIYGPATMVVLNAFQRAGVFRNLKAFIVFGKSWRDSRQPESRDI